MSGEDRSVTPIDEHIPQGEGWTHQQSQGYLGGAHAQREDIVDGRVEGCCRRGAILETLGHEEVVHAWCNDGEQPIA